LLSRIRRATFFLNRAYNELNNFNRAWTKKYIRAIGVASPANNVLGSTAPYLTFDNDIIQLVPDSLEPNVYNPNRDEYENAVGEKVDNIYSMKAHAFLSSYMATDATRDAILGFINGAVNEHKYASSQWKKDEMVNCGCDERISVKHRFDENLDPLMKDEQVISFNDTLKLYPIDGQYVKAFCGGKELIKKPSEDICFNLEGAGGHVINYIADAGDTYNPPNGLFNATLTWEERAVNLQMSSPTLMPESSRGCGKYSIGSGDMTLHSVYPGVYPIFATAEGADDIDDENLSDTVILSMIAVSADYHASTLVNNPAGYSHLGNNGHLADIIIDIPPRGRGENIITLEGDNIPVEGIDHRFDTSNTIISSNGTNNHVYSTSHHGRGGASPSACDGNCGCAPCRYKIIGYLNQVRLGPIAGARYRLYKASEEGQHDKEILFEGETSIGDNVIEAGLLSIPVPYQLENPRNDEEQALAEKIKSYDGDFILEISGGFDIDSNDDYIVDDVFTQVNGKLHAILSKKNVIENDFKVNVLTEIAYQASKDILGKEYDPLRLQARLDDIAKRVLIEKLYYDSSSPIDRNDLVYWIPAAHKQFLLKPYDTTLAPIVEKIYLGKNIYEDAYNYIYTDPQSDTVPLMQRLSIEVNESLSGGSHIGTLRLKSPGGSQPTAYHLSGNGSDDFNINASGRLSLAPTTTLNIQVRETYELTLVVENSYGKSVPVGLNIRIIGISDVPELISTDLEAIPENTQPGTLAAKFNFNPGKTAITSYTLSGPNADAFTIDSEGNLYTSETAQFSYKQSNYVQVIVQAINSFDPSVATPVYIAIVPPIGAPVINAQDLNVSEHAAPGTEVGKLKISSDKPLLDVKLSGYGSENFVVEIDGSIRIAAHADIDYEKSTLYRMNAVASNSIGEGSSGILTVHIKDEPDVPKLEPATLHILENTMPGSIIGQVNILDSGTSAIKSFELYGSASKYFTIDATGTLYLTAIPPVKNDVRAFHIYTYAINAEGTSRGVSLTIHIDAIVPVIQKWQKFNTSENTKVNTIIGTINMTSSIAPITSVILKGERSDDFMIDLNGDIRVAKPINFEEIESYSLQVIASNSNGNSTPTLIDISIKDLPDSIVLKGFATTIHDDITPNSIIGVIHVQDQHNDKIESFTLSGPGNEQFIIDADGTVRVAPDASLDDKLQNHYLLQVTAQASDGLESSRTLLDISISDSLNGRPVILPFSGNLSETTSPGSIVGYINVIDNGTSPIEIFKLSGTDSDVFTIDKQGLITTTKTLDFEKKEIYNLTIIAENQKSKSDPVSCTILLKNEPDTPPILDAFIGDIDENTPANTIIGQIPIVYTDEVEISSISLSGSGSSNFYVETDGTIKVSESASLDYETVPLYTLRAVAKSAVGCGAEKAVLIQLNDIGVAPELTSTNLNIDIYEADTNSLGNITIIQKPEAQVDSIVLKGEFSNLFSVNKTGTVSFYGDLFSMVDQNITLAAYAANPHGTSEPVDVNLSFYTKKPVLEETILSIDEGTQYAGRVPVLSAGLTPITSFELLDTGSDYFSIDASGALTVNDKNGLDYETTSIFELTAIASNSYGSSEPVNVTINVNNITDAPTLYDTTLTLQEHAPSGTIVGDINISEHQDCPITSIKSIYANSKFVIKADGTVTVAPDALIDYESSSTHSIYEHIVAQTDCGPSNEVRLTVELSDLDENIEAGFGVMQYSNVNIYEIEQDGSLTKRFKERVKAQKYGSTNNDYIGVFNSHKYEIDLNSYYLMEVKNGYELDIDTNGILEWSDKFPFKGKIRAIIKGSWLHEVEGIRVSPISEMVVDSLSKYYQPYEIATLETRLDDAAQRVLRTDIDGSGEIDIMDALKYDATYIYDPFVFLGDLQAVINGQTSIGTSVGAAQIFQIHEGSLSSLTLEGAGSEYFALNTQHSLLVNNSLFDKAGETFDLSLLATDEYNITSIGDISITIAPSMYLFSSYETGGNVRKIEATKAHNLFIAAGEAGIIVLNVSDPYNPILVTQINSELDINGTGVKITSLVLSDDEQTLFVADARQNKLFALDVSTPEEFNLVSTLSENALQDIVLSTDGDYLYAAGDTFDIIDISDIHNLQRVSSLDIDQEINGVVERLELSSTTVSIIYNSEGYAMVYADITDQRHPFLIKDEYDFPAHGWQTHRNRVIKNGILGFSVYGWDNQIIVWDMTTTDEWGNYQSIMAFETPENIIDLTLSQDEEYLYLSNGNKGITVVGFHSTSN